MLLFLTVPACQTAERAAERGGQRARGVIGMIEPTGLVGETKEREETWRIARQKIEQLDMDGLNATVGEVGLFFSDLRSKLNAVPQEQVAAMADDLAASTAKLRKELEGARIHQTTNTVLDLAETVDAKLKTLEVDRINELLQDVQLAVADLRGAVQRLGDDTSESLDHTNALLARATERLEAMPIDKLDETMTEVREAVGSARSAVAQAPPAAESLRAALAATRAAGYLTTVVLALTAVGLLLWIIRQARSLRA